MARALASDPINQLEENLQCAVCLEVLTDPRTLPCCHSFCKVCLERIVKTCRGKAPRGQVIQEFPCPNCRATFTLDPDKHVADMPRNHFICNMIKATAVLDRGIGVPCSHNCPQSYSVARCVSCEKFLCRECLTIHNSYRGHNGHSVLTMEELSKPENRKKINDKLYCNEHSGMELKVYCETCDQLICRDCMDFKHVKQGHSCVLVKDEANKYKELLALNNKAMEDALTKGNEFLQQLTLTTEQLDRDAENIRIQITQKKNIVLKTVTEMLEEKTRTLLKEVDDIRKAEQGKVNKQTEETKSYVKNIKTSLQLSKKLVDQGTEEEIISSQKMMLDNSKKLLTNPKDYFKTLIPVVKLGYTSSTGKEPLNKEILRGLVNSLGEVYKEKEHTETERDDNEKSRTILISGLPEGITENDVHIHFQKRRNGGGDIEKVTAFLERNTALVVFEDPEVAKRVVQKEQVFKEKILDVKLQGSNNEESGKEIVKNSQDEEDVHIQFQQKTKDTNAQDMQTGQRQTASFTTANRGTNSDWNVTTIRSSHSNNKGCRQGAEGCRYDDDDKPSFLSYAVAAGWKNFNTCPDPKLAIDGKKLKDDECSICLSEFTKKKTLEKCGHSFCTKCINKAFKVKKQCPLCFMVYSPLTGCQPKGNMYDSYQAVSLPGFSSCGTIVISYRFASGTQGPDHPNPGKPYQGTSRTAYLPNNDEGKKVLKLLKKAFDQKLTFTIGRSTTTGRDDCVTWNDIHHKTSMYGGPTVFGYPDPDYLKRVQDELAAKGITE